MWNRPFLPQTKVMQNGYRRYEDGPHQRSPNGRSSKHPCSTSHHCVTGSSSALPEHLRLCPPPCARSHSPALWIWRHGKNLNFKKFEQGIVIPCNLGGFLPHAIRACIILAGKSTNPIVSWVGSSFTNIRNLKNENKTIVSVFVYIKGIVPHIFLSLKSHILDGNGVCYCIGPVGHNMWK